MLETAPIHKILHFSQMGVLLTQTCSEGRKENDWFTASTNETEARAGFRRLNLMCAAAEGFLRNSRNKRQMFVGERIYCKVSEFTTIFCYNSTSSNVY